MIPAAIKLEKNSLLAIFRPAYAIYLLLLVLLLFGLAWPILKLFMRSLQDQQGFFTGLDNFRLYFATPHLFSAFTNTLLVALACTLITLILALIPALALTHARILGSGLCRMVVLLPMFVPSFFPAMGLIYLFGEQGIFKWLLGGYSLYGPLGVIMGSVLYTLPFAFLLLLGALRDIDNNLYLAARGLGAGPLRRFFTVTLPGAQYGIISAGIVIFTLTVADFGIPKVLGGNFAMLSTEIYKQIVGLQNFSLGATVSIVLLLPVVPAVLLDGWAGRRASRRSLSSRAGKAALKPERTIGRDSAMALAAWLVAALPLGVTIMMIVASLVSFWPYSLSLGLGNYFFGNNIYGVEPYFNSLRLAGLVGLCGTAATFAGAYLIKRSNLPASLSSIYRLLAILPLCVPGTVLGLSYVFAFNHVSWLAVLFGGSMSMLVLNTLIHLYPICHLNFSDSLSGLAGPYENVGATLGVTRAATIRRVIIPLQARAILEVFFYLFVSSLTTISALIFIYSARNTPASVGILQMFDSGHMGEASAMGVLLLLTGIGARIITNILQRYLCK